MRTKQDKSEELKVGDSVRKIKNVDAGEMGIVQSVEKFDSGIIKVKVLSQSGKLWFSQSQDNYEKIQEVVEVKDIPLWNEDKKTMNLPFPVEFDQWLQGDKIFDEIEIKRLEVSWRVHRKSALPRQCSKPDVWKCCWEHQRNAAKNAEVGLPVRQYPRAVMEVHWIPSWFHKLFKVDMWGNIISVDGLQGAMCYAEEDHLFPSSRGGRTSLANLVLIQFVANRKKKEKILPFLTADEEAALSCGLQEHQFLAITNHSWRMFGCKERNFGQLYAFLTQPLGWETGDLEALQNLNEGDALWAYFHQKWCAHNQREEEKRNPFM
ncbi:hypothetical protein GUITHDRAFT_144431 [Guillardia theta CCMP2712]|uniref:Uncharacterized protein n=1 Tax=Guillardia theta (strain CCMP2712) TaxID=905079 RepID=L1IPC8_GUITC|nr:hypothetical protein GUITHDRAFT_144431 [Guillardia theta CCMP2712]EKX38118.1 hypothetical protein GUITHDRAFT_144431 [Guillardia theta CCMP2712]|eukprot:XP_005825098.1 hypothetical protein GUITHDRAFT_144431 [Guillardia theta CCMP2712]